MKLLWIYGRILLCVGFIYLLMASIDGHWASWKWGMGEQYAFGFISFCAVALAGGLSLRELFSDK